MQKKLKLNNLPNLLLATFILMVIVLLCIFPKKYSAICLEGIFLWAKVVLPSLFPFLILTTLLTKLGVLQKLSIYLNKFFYRLKLPSLTAGVFLISILSGYPIGAKMIADLYTQNAITEKEATRMALLCSTSGPMFIIGSVGAVLFNSAIAGCILFIAHILAVILPCLIALPFAKKLPKTEHAIQTKPVDNLLYSCVHSSTISILCIGGFIALFYILTEALTDLKIIQPIIYLFSFLFKESATGLVYGLLEATHGIAALASSNTIFALPLAAFAITFGGGCILLQQISFLKVAKVKIGRFIAFKFIQGVTAFALTLLAVWIFF